MFTKEDVMEAWAAEPTDYALNHAQRVADAMTESLASAAVKIDVEILEANDERILVLLSADINGKVINGVYAIRFGHDVARVVKRRLGEFATRVGDAAVFGVFDNDYEVMPGMAAL